MYLFFDTETTGLPNYDLPLTDKAQPHIVQLALVLTDEDGREAMVWKGPIVPEGFTIDEGGRAFEVNKIGNEFANKYGVSLAGALTFFRSFQNRAVLKVAHNYRFDGFLLKAAHEKNGIDPGPVIDKFCTMKAMTDIMKLPPTANMVAAGFDKPKSAKLSEAYKYCTGKELVGAHDALADVRACKDVFFWLKEKGLYKPQPRVVPAEAAA